MYIKVLLSKNQAILFYSILVMKNQRACVFVLISYFIEDVAKSGGWEKRCTEGYDHVGEVDYRKVGEEDSNLLQTI